jgi:uncharacterized protein YdhG (YjbR/CyaY superfamily)
MARVNVPTVDAYIERQPAPARPVLRRIRQAIRKAIPEADEGISYGMPTYKQNGKAILYFAGWARHCSIYPATAAVKEAVGRLEPPLEFENGTLRLPLSLKIPQRLVATFATVRSREAAAHAAGTAARQRPKKKRTQGAPGPKRQNAAWHSTHRLPRGASLQERIRWHVAHRRACGCRPMPDSVRAAIERR